MNSKGKKTFWVANAITEAHKQRASLLQQNGFDVTFVSAPADVISQSKDGRPLCILIDSPFSDGHLAISSIQLLVRDPELNGVRFIASLTQDSPEFIRLAVSENFRDLISIQLPVMNWIQRIQAANMPNPTESISSLCEIGMNQVAVAVSPARINWISQNKVRIECRGANLGSSFHVSGAISRALNLPHISVTVERIEKGSLIYRYSQALVCSWRVPSSHTEKARQLIEELIQNKPDPKVRAFIAVSRPSLRTSLVRGLNPERFVARAALQRSNIPFEIKFVSPHVLFLDDKLLSSLTSTEIRDILTQLPKSSPLVIFGAPSNETLLALSERGVFVERDLQHDHLINAETRYELSINATDHNSETAICPISPEHPWSKINVHGSARLVALGPTSGRIALPFSIGSFSLATLEAPILRKALGRDPIIKIAETLTTNSQSMFNTEHKFRFVDLTKQEQSQLATSLLEMVSQYYASQIGTSITVDTLISDVANSSADDMIRSINETELALDISSTRENLSSGAGFDGSAARTDVEINAPEVRRKKETFRPKQGALQTATRTGHNATFRTAKKARSSFAIDTTIVKAIVILMISAVALVFLLRLAEKVGENRDNELGREYSDFFFRMNPELRKKIEKNDQNGNNSP